MGIVIALAWPNATVLCVAMICFAAMFIATILS